MPIEYGEVAAGRAASGSRLVAPGTIASPWAEAAKGMFAIAELPLLVVPRPRDPAEVIAWTGIDNVPVLVHEQEPARTNWAAIVGLVNRLAAPDTILPADPRRRAEVFGLLDLLAGEGGVGWNARRGMIQDSLDSNGERGFTVNVANYLAKRYGHTAPVEREKLRDQVRGQLAILRESLGAKSYFGGDRPAAVDVYVTTFLTPLTVIDDAVCPQMSAANRKGFASAREMLADLVPDELWSLRTRMFERHLPMPIRLA